MIEAAPAATSSTLPLTGDFQLVSGFNLNGIDATPNGKTLVVVQSVNGKLFRVSTSGATTEIDLGGGLGIPYGADTEFTVNFTNQGENDEVDIDVAAGETVGFPAVLVALQWLRARRTPTRLEATGPVAVDGERGFPSRRRQADSSQLIGAEGGAF